MPRGVPTKNRQVSVDGRAVTYGSALPDSVVSRETDGRSSTDSNNAGLRISISQNWSQFQAKLSSNTKTASDEEMVIEQVSDGTELASIDISGLSSGGVVTFDSVNLTKNNDYDIYCRTSKSRQRGFDDDASYPYPSDDGNLRITAGYFNGSVGGFDDAFNIITVGNINL